MDDNEQGRRGEIKPWEVLKAIPGTNGALSEIAEKLHVGRSALQRFLQDYPEIQAEIESEREASVERIMREQYNDALDGNMQARESYIKMVKGYFDKKDEKKQEGDGIQVNIVMPEQSDEPQMALDPDTRELIELDENMQPKGR